MWVVEDFHPAPKIVRPVGFEPTTVCLKGNCSTRLSYGRVFNLKYFGAGRASDRLLKRQLLYQAELTTHAHPKILCQYNNFVFSSQYLANFLVNEIHICERQGHPDERRPTLGQISISGRRNIGQREFFGRNGKRNAQKQDDLQKAH